MAEGAWKEAAADFYNRWGEALTEAFSKEIIADVLKSVKGKFTSSAESAKPPADAYKLAPEGSTQGQEIPFKEEPLATPRAPNLGQFNSLSGVIETLSKGNNFKLKGPESLSASIEDFFRELLLFLKEKMERVRVTDEKSLAIPAEPKVKAQKEEKSATDPFSVFLKSFGSVFSSLKYFIGAKKGEKEELKGGIDLRSVAGSGHFQPGFEQGQKEEKETEQSPTHSRQNRSWSFNRKTAGAAIGSAAGEFASAAMTSGPDSGAETTKHVLRGVGSLADLAGPLGAPIKGLTALGEIAVNISQKLMQWADNLHRGNLQFAEFSGSMRAVQQEQAARDITLSAQRGDRLAESARVLAEARSRLQQQRAIFDDALTQQRNLAAAEGQALQANLQRMINEAVGLHAEVEPEGEPLSDWVHSLAQRTWAETYGTPFNWFDATTWLNAGGPWS